MASYQIEIVPYDPGWPAAYEKEVHRLHSAIGHNVVRFEHMGSSSVPGLAAKPIIDISAAVQSLAEAPELFPLLERLGYQPIPQDSPDRYDLWLQPGEGPPTHILHFMEADSEAWIRPLIFRNALRADAALREEYMVLKAELAERCGSDIKCYGKGKGEFINRVIDSFLAERSS